MLKNLFKKKQQLEINVNNSNTQTEQEQKLYEEERARLIQEYRELYPTAIIMIKDFQDFGTLVSFTQTEQESIVYNRNIPHYEVLRNYNNKAINELFAHFKLIKNDFSKMYCKSYKKEYLIFCKSNTNNSYYHISDRNVLYLNEHDWNILTGKVK